MSLLTKVFFQSIDLASNAQDWANNQQLKALLLVRAFGADEIIERGPGIYGTLAFENQLGARVH